MVDIELFDVISYKVKEGKRGARILHTTEPVAMEDAKKVVADLESRKLDLGIIEIVEDLGID